MTLKIDLTPDLELRLVREAERRGVPAETFTLELLEKHLPPEDKRAELICLLQSWIDEGDAEEQRDTGEYLIRTLDEDRLSDRKLFPAELKGKTW